MSTPDVVVCLVSVAFLIPTARVMYFVDVI